MPNPILTPTSDAQRDILPLEGTFAPRPAVFVYSGQGGFWWSMGRELLTQHPAARAVVDQLDALFTELRWLDDDATTLWAELTRDEATCQFQRTPVIQMCLFALQVALTEYWRSRDIEPVAVVGHSLGELAAGWAAGLLTLQEAARVLVARCRGQKPMDGQGGMMAVALGEHALCDYAELQEGIVIAAVNGPRSVTVAGPDVLLQQLGERLRKDRVLARRLPIDGAYHSPTVDPIRPVVLAVLGTVTVQQETCPFYSTLIGDRVRAEEMHATYWYDNIRDPVRFERAIEALLRNGYDTFVEIGAAPIHARELTDLLERADSPGLVVPSLKRGEADADRLASSLRALYTPRPTRPERQVG